MDSEKLSMYIVLPRSTTTAPTTQKPQEIMILTNKKINMKF